jgi:hypothetical protein
LPIAMSRLLRSVPRIFVTSSGAEATMVSPITSGGTPSRAANREPARVKSSAPPIKAARPNSIPPDATIELETGRER